MRISDWSSDVCSSDLMPLPVVTFSPEIEMLLNQAVRANPAAEWPFEHGMAMTIIEQVGQAVEPLLLQTRSFALVASPICRSALSRLVRATFPDVAVIRSEEHTSELQSLMRISYAVFCLKKKKKQTHNERPSNHQN